MLAKHRNQGYTPATPMKQNYPEKHYPHTLTFADALRYNDGDLVRHLIANGLNPNSCGSDGRPLLLAARRAWKGSVIYALEKAGATEETFSEEERQEAALHREPLYRGQKELMQRPLLELCREQMKEAEAEGNQELLAGLRDRERRLAYQAPVFDEAAFQTLLRDLEAAGISIPTPAEWPHEYRIPRTHAMAAMDILIEHGDPALLKRLLGTGVNPNEPLYQHDDDEIVLPLCEALHGHAALVPVLLEYGADPSGDGEDAIPLMKAFGWSPDSAQLVHLLLDAGANPFVEDSCSGSTPLLDAVVHGYYRVVTRLLNMGVNPNPDGEDIWHLPLTQAIADSDVGLVRELLDAGASPFLIPSDCVTWDTDGQSPLYMAEYEFRINARLPYREAEDKRRRKHSRRVLESIYERYPDIDRLPIPDPWEPHTDNPAYFNAALWNTAAYGLRESAVTLLHYHNASPNACNSAGIPALVIAAARGHADVVYELLCYGATPELPAPLLAAAGCQEDVDEEIRRLVQCFSPAAHGSTTSTKIPV